MSSVYPLDAAWLMTLPDLHARLQREPPARIADIGCADGWFSIALAQRYPKVRVDGFDLDDVIIDLAWGNAHHHGLTDRLTFHLRDVSEPTLNGRYDLCIAHQGLIGMRNPLGVLATMRRLAGEQGSVLVTATDPSPANGHNDDSLYGNALVVGFHRVEVVPVGHGSLRFYRFYQTDRG